jgi:FixJ family two-component response regulator
MTVGQARVADCVARGLPYPAIAAELGIKEQTVRVHVVAIATHCLPEDFRNDQRAYLRVLCWFFQASSERQQPIVSRAD